MYNKLLNVAFVVCILILEITSSIAQNVGVNESGTMPHASAGLDVDFTNKGMLIPRLTTAQRDIINGGVFVNSLFIFNTTDNCLQIYNSASMQWENMYCFSGCTSGPAIPVANAATSIGETDFQANWSASSGATKYFLDVDDDSDFSSPLIGYNNIEATGLSKTVVGLVCESTYYYRVRASNDCGTSSNSNAIGGVSVGTCSVNCVEGPAAVVDVVSAGKTWMDRNLGASQVAASHSDEDSYGDLYQWGRFTDGHQCRTSTTTGVNSGTDTPGHDMFITESSTPFDWRVPQNDNLWQGVTGINNPCPAGYRIPTETEFETERLSWVSNNQGGAFGSPLSLPSGGLRDNGTGALTSVETFGYYWVSTLSAEQGRVMHFWNSGALMSDTRRAYGFSVRCIKN